jgi:hypothetical protein
MGGEGVATTIAKGPVHIAMDAQLNYWEDKGGFVNRPKILEALQSSRLYADLLKDPDIFNVPPAYADYVVEYWYSPDHPKVWWQDKQPVAPIVRQSLIKAIELATTPDPKNPTQGLPIDSYWLPSSVIAGGPHPFEVIITRSLWQVTRLILTPPSPRPQNFGLLTDVADIWVVKRATVGEWETVEDPSSGLVVTRLKAFPRTPPTSEQTMSG